MNPPSYDLRPCLLSDVQSLCGRFHGYGSTGNTATYAFGVYEGGRVVAGFLWQPPSLGAAKSVCPELPQAVLALSRMVAVPKEDRNLQKISTPLRRQMRMLIDRTRWPVLVTYSDEGQGHTGHVYKCSGWERTTRSERPAFEDPETGKRVAPTTSSAGLERRREMVNVGLRWVQRWEHWSCARGAAADVLRDGGWIREPVPGKVWRSGNPAFRWTRADDAPEQVALFGVDR